MKIYKMNEWDWVASSLSKEATNEWYKKEVGFTEDDQPIDWVMECDIEKDGMYIEVTFEEAYKLLDKLYQENRVHNSNELKFVNYYGRLAMWVTFEIALKEYKTKKDIRDPFIIASTEL